MHVSGTLRLTDSGPFDEIFTYLFIIIISMLKNLGKKKDLNGVRDGEFHQINVNYTKEPNRNFRTEI